MPVYYGAIDLAKNELRNAVVQNLGSAPASPVKGQIYFDSTQNILFWYNGTSWVPAQAGAGTPTGPAGGALSGTYPNPTLAANSVASSNIVDGTIVIADISTASVRLDTVGSPAGNVSMASKNIVNLLDPVNAQDGATKNYVDTTAQGLDAKQSVKAASTANLTLSGTQTVDGIALVAGDRILVKDQTTQSQNGIYVVAAGAWTRSTDMDIWTEFPGAFTFVEQGTVNADNGFVCTADQGGTLNTTAVTWTQFSGAGQITAGGGLTKTGNQIDVGTSGNGILVNADNLAIDTSVIATIAYVSGFAPKNNPVFTGDPQAPTPTAGDNDTSIATTAFVTGAINTAVAARPRKFAAALTGTASPETVTHNLNTQDIQLTVLNGASPYTAVEVDWDATSANTATVRYNPNLGSGYRVVIVG